MPLIELYDSGNPARFEQISPVLQDQGNVHSEEKVENGCFGDDDE